MCSHTHMHAYTNAHACTHMDTHAHTRTHTHTHTHTHRLATGSFDKKCKLWTGDGKLMFQLQCVGSVTGICFVPNTEVLWVAAGGSINYYDPKSADCVRTSLYCTIISSAY